MAIEGELNVRLAWDGRDVRGVSIVSTRPFAATRVLRGMAPAEATATVARLFGVCGIAQETAAASALDAASGVDPAAAVHAGTVPVELEAIQEYLWRLLLDWPQAMGREMNVPPVAEARQRIADAQKSHRVAQGGAMPAKVVAEVARTLGAIATTHVYGTTPDAFLALADSAALEGWIARADTLPASLLGTLLESRPSLGKSDVALMPSLRGGEFIAQLLPELDHPEFARAPQWAGAPAETGALARMQAHPLVVVLRARHGNAVVVRMMARLAELAFLLTRLAAGRGKDAAPCWIEAIATARGEGVAAVQTARGLLLHRARVENGRVAGYQIVAPTEWNFHPAGALARGLEGMRAADEATLLSDAGLVVQGLDPCVACRIEVGHA
jgi:Ni,Fe-hydrogenase I large subunit